VADPKIVDFKPRWMRELNERDREILSGPAFADVAPPASPRIDMRIVTQGEASGVTARALVAVVQQTQALVSHAGCDLFYGFDPGFTDLRSASAEVFQLTQLTIEPGEEGSYILPARLDARPAEVVEAEARRRITTEDVVHRFVHILSSAGDPAAAEQVSLGALRDVEELGRLLKREASLIEYQPVNSEGRFERAVSVDLGYLERVTKIRTARQPTRTLLETLEGKVTALDLDEETLQLRLEGSTRRVKGTFSRLLHPVLISFLDRRVRLHGQVTRRGRAILTIEVQQVEPIPSA
jgi:hypothetical protein